LVLTFFFFFFALASSFSKPFPHAIRRRALTPLSIFAQPRHSPNRSGSGFGAHDHLGTNSHPRHSHAHSYQHGGGGGGSGGGSAQKLRTPGSYQHGGSGSGSGGGSGGGGGSGSGSAQKPRTPGSGLGANGSRYGARPAHRRKGFTMPKADRSGVFGGGDPDIPGPGDTAPVAAFGSSGKGVAAMKSVSSRYLGTFFSVLFI
jgi:hypothetical protein